MTAPTVSVVVPVRDVADYLDACLDSLARQTHDRLQVVCVDDGSRDDSARIAGAWADRDPRFTLLRRPATGVGAARNAGIDLAVGDYLGFVDGDDLVPPGAVAALLAALRTSTAPIALGSAVRIDDAGTVTPSATHDAVLTRFGEVAPADHPALARDRFVWAKLYRRSAWEHHRLRFPPTMRYEDYPVALAATLAAARVALVDAEVYRWRIRGSGTSITQTSLDPGNRDDRIRSAAMVTALVADPAIPAPLRREVHEQLARIDLVRLLQGFAVADPDTAPGLLSACRELLALIDPAVLTARPRSERLQHRWLRDGWWWALRELAVVRAGRRGFAEYEDALASSGPLRRRLTRLAVDGRRGM